MLDRCSFVTALVRNGVQAQQRSVFVGIADAFAHIRRFVRRDLSSKKTRQRTFAKRLEGHTEQSSTNRVYLKESKKTPTCTKERVSAARLCLELQELGVAIGQAIQ